MTDKYYVVTAISQYRMRYVVPVEDLKLDGHVEPVWAADSVTMNEVNEFSQEHLGETVLYQYKNTLFEDYRTEMFEKYPEVKTVPQIWWNNRHIGGYAEFAKEIENTLGDYGQSAF